MDIISKDRFFRFRFPKLSNLTFFRSLRFEIILLLIVVGIIPCIATYVGIITAYESRAVSLRISDIQNQSTNLAAHLSGDTHLEGDTAAIIRANIAQFTNIYQGHVTVIDHEYQILFDTRPHPGRSPVSNVYATMTLSDGSVQGEMDRRNSVIHVTVPIYADVNYHGVGDDGPVGPIIGAIIIEASAETIIESVQIFHNRGLRILIVTFILIFALSLLVSYIIVKPIRKVTASFETVTEGFEEDIVEDETFLEVKQLTHAFKKMLGRLKIIEDSRKEFVSNVSHELRTPLASMKVLADSLLAMEDAPKKLYREFLEDITKEIDRENEIITDLLSLVKMDKTTGRLNIQKVSINDLLDLILKRLRPIAEQKNIELVSESYHEVIAEIDEVKMTLALSNLVENAIKYNHDGGWVHVTLDSDGQYCSVKVADNGAGIPEDAINHVFERFYRIDKSHSQEIGGTGLGLSIARNAVIMHRGLIKVQSQVGEGSTFTLRIPLKYTL